jgi:phosphoglycolate phosphatase
VLVTPAQAGAQSFIFIFTVLLLSADLTNSIRAVILDLDGTLVDTASEIAAALNRTLEELGLTGLEQGAVEALIGKGVRVLVERALQQVEGGALIELDPAVERFEAHYAQTVGTDARLFAGVMPGLRRFAEAGIAMSVVTNKPRFFTEMLLERLEVAPLLAAVVAGDDGIRRKPHADMLLAACERMGSTPAQSLMLGDSDNDVIAARAAGCPVWCVPYGYNEGRPPETLACDRLVQTVDEAARLIAPP